MGKVQSIRKRSFYGSPEATYAQLLFEREDLTLTLLERDLPGTVRKLMSAKEARHLLDHIDSCDSRASKNLKSRAKAHQAAIESGDPFKYARVAKELTRMKQSEELRPSDKTNLADSMRLLEEELSRVLRKSRTQIAKRLQEALNDPSS